MESLRLLGTLAAMPGPPENTEAVLAACWALQLQSMHLSDGFHESFILTDLITRLSLWTKDMERTATSIPPLGHRYSSGIDSRIWVSARASMEESVLIYGEEHIQRFARLLLDTITASTTSVEQGAAAYHRLLVGFGNIPQAERNNILFGRGLASRVIAAHFLAVSLLMSAVAFTQDCDLQICPLSCIPRWIEDIRTEIELKHSRAETWRILWPVMVAESSKRLGHSSAENWVSLSSFFDYIQQNPNDFILQPQGTTLARHRTKSAQPC